MAKQKTTEQSLESIMWNCRNALRGTVGGNEKNRDAVMGLVFLKFAGDKFDKRREDIKAQYGDVPVFLEKRSFYLSENVFYLNETSRWSFIVKNAKQGGIAVIIDSAMKDIEDGNPPLKGALPQNFYATLGTRPEQMSALISEIDKINEARFHDRDLIGRVYEYFLQVFAIDSGTSNEKGEFYTPASIVQLIAELIEPYSGVVYDPCCGAAGMFVSSIKFVERHNGNRSKISVVGQERNPDTWRLAKMNLAIRGIAHNLGERPESTFADDLHKDKKVDFIMANPPFNLKLNAQGVTQDKLNGDPRWDGYSPPPVSNANYAWILHMLSKLDVTNGIAGFLLANGALNADGVEGEIRKRLVENDKVEAIIVLPREMFYSTDISVTLWILNNNKKARFLNGRQMRDRQGEVPDAEVMNRAVEKMVRDAITCTGIENIVNAGEPEDVFSDEFMKRIDEINLPITKFNALLKLLRKTILGYGMVNKVKAIEFDKRLRAVVENYNNRDKLVFTSEVVADFIEGLSKELIKILTDLQADKTSFEALGITYEEKAFYDILVKVRNDHGFPYADEKCLVLAKEIKKLVDDKAQFADWSTRADIKNQLNRDLTVLLYKNGYPPEWDEEVFEKVLEQAENFKKWAG